MSSVTDHCSFLDSVSIQLDFIGRSSLEPRPFPFGGTLEYQFSLLITNVQYIGALCINQKRNCGVNIRLHEVLKKVNKFSQMF